jgi:hypothetical protein
MFESLGFLFTAAASINYLLLYSVAAKGQQVYGWGKEVSMKKNSSVSGTFDRITCPSQLPL